MKAIRKCPGQGPEIVDVPSEETVLEMIGPNICKAMPATDVVIFWDGNWKENGKEQNENLLGVPTGGTVLVLGVENGQLTDIPKLDFVLHGLFGAVRYGRADRANNVWNCRHCGHMERFEADGPFENGWNLCPVCGGWIVRGAPPVAGSSDLNNGERCDCRQWREEGAERVAAVKISRADSKQEILGTATGNRSADAKELRQRGQMPGTATRTEM